MFENSLIPADMNWLVLTALFSIALFGLWGEKTKFGSLLSGTVIIILTAIFLSNLSIIPTDSSVYNIVWSYFVPLAIPLLLFKANLKKIIKETGPALIAFIIGSIGTVIGTLLAFFLIPLGPEGWKIAAIFCSTYIGGSINYVSTAEAVGLKSGDLLAAGVAADMLVMALFFILLLSLPSIPFIRKRYIKKKYIEEEVNIEISSKTKPSVEKKINNDLVFNMFKALSLSALLCAAGYGIADLLGVKSLGILFLTGFTLVLATLFPEKMGNIRGADDLGMFFMQIFFAVIGAGANIWIVINKGPVLFFFAGFILIIHLIFLLVLGKLFKLDIIELVVASNANLGGPTTAAAMAAARNWKALVIPAILIGTLGYAFATFIGVAVGFWLK